jgi:cytochrome c biogenesis protein CcmG, thiol:disulfide interchange protein DsbE
VFTDPPAESGLTSLVGVSGKPMTLADTDEDLAVHGRIGYGHKSPWFLGGIFLLVVLVLGFASYLSGREDDPSGIPDVAPEFEMALFDGSTFRLADHRGKVVVLNFWASWCEPCRDEMPALQLASTQAGADVVFVGIGAKTDKDDEARAFAEEFAITYPIGRDTEGGDRVNGSIQTDYGVFAFPSTYVIDPEGNIETVLMTPIDDPADIQPFIDAARG